MAVGIWTPVVLSNVKLVFSDRLNTFANKLQTTALVAGTHMMVRPSGCQGPVYVHTSAPADDTAGFTGTPVTEDMEFVMPRVSPIWIYCPYDNAMVDICVGALT